MQSRIECDTSFAAWLAIFAPGSWHMDFPGEVCGESHACARHKALQAGVSSRTRASVASAEFLASNVTLGNRGMKSGYAGR